jgi:hypothetical protein
LISSPSKSDHFFFANNMFVCLFFRQKVIKEDTVKRNTPCVVFFFCNHLML